MTNSLTTMNEDVMLEIMSYCPATEIGKLRLLNKECNKRSYELSFIKRHLQRTNSVFGYFIHYRQRCKNKSYFVSSVGKEESTPISLYFLPRGSCAAARIEACDSHHGILLCVDDTWKGGKRIPDYIVCKPATQQYQIIPNPKTRWGTIATGLMVITSNPFRYKIIRVSSSGTGWRRDGVYHYFCEVFDSDLFAWKRLKNTTLKSSEFYLRDDKPVSAYGCLHWLTMENNVMRFCMRTETWSTFPVPDEFTCDKNLILVSYEGKLGVIHSRWGEESNMWVLDKSLGKSWKIVKSAKITAFDVNAQPVWFPSNDVVSTASNGRLGLYNMSRNNYGKLRAGEVWEVFPDGPPRDYIIPFYSNYDRVCLKKDHVYEIGPLRLRSIMKTKEKMIVIQVISVAIILLFTSLFFFSYPQDSNDFGEKFNKFVQECIFSFYY